MKYWPEICFGIGGAIVIDILLLSGWLGRIMGAAAVILGS